MAVGAPAFRGVGCGRGTSVMRRDLSFGSTSRPRAAALPLEASIVLKPRARPTG
jgi:hypothetical protein